MGLKEIGIKNSNILNYTTWEVGTSGSQPGFGQNGDGNSIVEANDPWGKVVPVWQSLNNDTDSGADGGWNGSHFGVDVNKMYRFSVWVRRLYKGDGSFYLGCRGIGSNVLNRNNGSGNGNPYFEVNGDWNEWGDIGSWYLTVGHIWPAGSGTGSIYEDSGVWKADGELEYVSGVRDFVWASGTTESELRTYLYYSTIPETHQQWVYPRVDIVDGTEPSLEELLAGYDSRIFDRINEIGSENETKAFQVKSDFTQINRVSELGPTDGLVGYWPLDGNADDYSGNGNHGTVSGATPTAGKIGQAYLFDSYPEHIMTSAQVSQLNTFTYSFWVYRNSTQDAFLIIGSRYGNNSYISAAIIGNKACLHKYYFNNSSDINIASSSRSLTTSVWYHLAITYDEGVTKTYVDGALEGTGNHVNSHADARNLQFNYESSVSDTYRYFLGKLDDVRIYSRALSAEEVSILYEMGEYRKAKMTASTMYVNQVFEK